MNISNSSGIGRKFEEMEADYSKMFNKRAFVHHFLAQGMDEMEFQEA